jgi:hypothetical protein
MWLTLYYLELNNKYDILVGQSERPSKQFGKNKQAKSRINFCEVFADLLA